jgi:hypothetical protein
MICDLRIGGISWLSPANIGLRVTEESESPFFKPLFEGARAVSPPGTRSFRSNRRPG